MVRITVHVTPRSGRDQVQWQPDGALRVRLRAAPVDGAANEALVRLLAKSLCVSKSAVAIISGATSRTKVVEVSGLDAENIAEKSGRELG